MEYDFAANARPGAKLAGSSADRDRVLAEAIFRTIHEPVVVFDQELRVISANPAFMSVFGLETQTIQRRALHELENPVLRNRALAETVKQLARRADPIIDREITIEVAGEEPRTLMLTGQRLPDNAPGTAMILLVVDDVTDRHRSIDQQFQAVLDAMPDPMMTTSVEGLIGSVNAALVRLFGYDAGELIGHPIDILVAADCREGYRALHRAYRDDLSPRPMGRGLEIHGLTKSGRAVPLEIALTPIRTAAGRTITAVMRDISDRRRAEQMLRTEAQRANRVKLRFLQAASHDLGRPLQVIRLLHGVLAARITDPTVKPIQERLETTVEAMSGVLDAFVEASQLQRGTIVPSIVSFPVAGLLARLQAGFRPLATAKGLTPRIVPSSATIRSDPRLLERILGNLLANAVQYTDSGTILLGCRRNGETLRIEVRDTGRGIPMEHVAEIFDEFYQVDPSASPSNANVGIGLYIVDQLARLLGHTVAVRSSPGKGTVFSVTVPLDLSHAGANASAAHGLSAAGASGHPSVLVVEDDEAQRHSIQLLLSAHGYTVETARTAKEAIVLTEGSSGFRPDVVLADYHLGGDMTGLDVLRRIADEIGWHVPGVVITGDVSSQTTRAIVNAGFHPLHKPIRPSALLQVIQDLARPVTTGLEPAPRPVPAPDPLPAGPATIAIVDADRDVSDAMRDILAANGFHAAGHTSAEAFLSDPNRPGYDCLLVDIDLPGMDGLELQRVLAAEGTSPPMIFITGNCDLPLAVRAMRDGAADCLAKPVRATALLESVALALKFRPADGRGTSRDFVARRDTEARIGELTLRQREVLRRMVDGQPNKNIAADLKLSQRTVEHHRSGVMMKLGARSLAELIRMVAPIRL